MQTVHPFGPNVNPEPRIHPKIGSITPAASKGQPQSKGEHIANQYQNNKDTVLNLGYYEHSKG
jgi:hypothetical protein